METAQREEEALGDEGEGLLLLTADLLDVLPDLVRGGGELRVRRAVDAGGHQQIRRVDRLVL